MIHPSTYLTIPGRHGGVEEKQREESEERHIHTKEPLTFPGPLHLSITYSRSPLWSPLFPVSSQPPSPPPPDSGSNGRLTQRQHSHYWVNLAPWTALYNLYCFADPLVMSWPWSTASTCTWLCARFLLWRACVCDMRSDWKAVCHGTESTHAPGLVHSEGYTHEGIAHSMRREGGRERNEVGRRSRGAAIFWLSRLQHISWPRHINF